MKGLLLIALLLGYHTVSAQYTIQKTNWNNAGYKGTKPSFTQVVNITAFGADNTGVNASNTAFTNAVGSLNGKPGVIYFPAGSYSFNAAIDIGRDSIILRGAGYDSTQLRFNLSGQVVNLININGTVSAADTAQLTASGNRQSTVVAVNNAASFHAGDWITLTMDDQAFMTSAWAYGSLSQTMQVQSISGNNITLSSPLRFNYALTNRPVIRKIVPRNNVGIECLKIQRLDATSGQSSNIAFDRAVNCWVNGIESDTTNFAHIEINHAANVEVTNSYFHDAFAYGGNGQAYGVLLQFGSNECKVEANYFRHLRHSMLLQAGANGNVLGYNYSVNPFWTEPNLPDSSAGDIVLHGNWPFMNLAEGNFIRNIVIDDSHGKNGTFNTFLRNRAEGYGIFMNFNPSTDSVQFIGNEITNTQIGLNFLQGVGHTAYGNNYRGTFTSGNANIPDTSLYLSPGQKPPCPAGYDTWPVVGRPNGYNTGTIYAKARVAAGKPAACSCINIPSTSVSNVSRTNSFILYPNPADDHVVLQAKNVQADRLELYNMAGDLVLLLHKPGTAIDVRQLPAGLYIARIIAGDEVSVQKLQKH